MIKDSFFISILINLLNTIKNYSQESFICTQLAKFIKSFVSCCKNSFFFNKFLDDGYFFKNFENSLFYKFIYFVFNFLSIFFSYFGNKFRDTVDSSLFLKLLEAFKERISFYSGLLIALIFMAPHDYWNNFYAVLIMFFLFFIISAVSMFGEKTEFNIKSIGVYAFIFMTFMFLSFVFSSDISKSFRFFLFFVSSFFMMVTPSAIIKNKKDFYCFLIPILFAMSLGGLYGVYQSIVGVPLKSWQVDLNVNEGISGRIYSLYENPNNFAELIVLIIPFFVALLIECKNIFIKAFSLISIGMLSVSMIYTYSRSGWIALAFSMGIFLLFIKPKWVPFLAILGLMAIPFLPISIYKRIMTIFAPNDTSSQYRFAIIQTMWPLIKERWFTGYGLGTDVLYDYANVFFKNIRTLSVMKTKSIPIHCHNLYLQVWAEMGILGIISFLAFITNYLKRCFKAFFSPLVHNDYKVYIVAGFSSICGVLLIGLAEYVIFYPRNMMMFFLVIGLTFSVVKVSKKFTIL